MNGWNQEQETEMESDKYSDSQMLLRQECIMLLQKYLMQHQKEVYEFSHDWIAKGNNDTTYLEEDFLKYVSDIEKWTAYEGGDIEKWRELGSIKH